MDIARISKFLPTVETPAYRQPFNARIRWTLIALICYLVLSNIVVWGVAPLTPEQREQFRFFEIVLGARFGSLMTLGIGPIVTAGIILQLLVGSKLIPWDMTEPENQRKFQAYNKLLAIAFAFIEAIAFVVGGALPLLGGIEVGALVALQLAAGGIIVLLLDELISKWGFGSGISLFIAVGVGTRLVIGAISPIAVPVPDPNNPGPYVGRLWNFLLNILAGRSNAALLNFLPLVSTIIIFMLVVFMAEVGIDIPIGFAALRGFGRSWSLKFLYTSNIPVIFAAAILANLQLMARLSSTPGPGGLSCSFLGCFDELGNPVSGVLYYLSAPNLLVALVRGVFALDTALRMICYASFMAIIAMIFSTFWVTTAGMDAASISEQFEAIGLQIPGYRRDRRTMESVLNRYIPTMTMFGGAAVGLLAALADFTGALGTGMGILLTVMIMYGYQEQLRREGLEEAHPIFRRVLGE